ncbi:GntR family transcriptional regulator [Aquincola tertiaricarbonis]|uniref:GntR family transcriptional regulator n=1 Tax=Aquincola tertiaricarbonis TaxID=391953 RepID=UPI000614ECE0|nr:GntR family transcriptional regulator [Aquincola tertiaricarbonis]
MLPWLTPTTSKLIDEVRETPLGRIVRDEVLSLILGGELAPGDRINEPDVAARLGVSRVPVREALRELESSGLVASRKHFGVYVRVLTPKEIADLYELRSTLDGHAGFKAAQLPSTARKTLGRKLEGLMGTMEKAAARHDVQRYYTANLGFHWAFVEASDNAALANAYRGVVQQLHLSRLKNLSQDTGMQASIKEHRAVLQSLSKGHAADCQALLQSHVSASFLRLAAQDGSPAS